MRSGKRLPRVGFKQTDLAGKDLLAEESFAMAQAAMTPDDHSRIDLQRNRVFDLMQDGQWRTLSNIAAATGDPTQSISARLRDFRKDECGGHTVERKHEGGGLYLY